MSEACIDCPRGLGDPETEFRARVYTSDSVNVTVYPRTIGVTLSDGRGYSGGLPHGEEPTLPDKLRAEIQKCPGAEVIARNGISGFLHRICGVSEVKRCPAVDSINYDDVKPVIALATQRAIIMSEEMDDVESGLWP
jgi:hypothetical protein